MFRKENVDRRLLTGAVILFIIQALWLCADLGLLQIPGCESGPVSHDRTAIGELVNVRENVRRRAFATSIWENSRAPDQLFANDSILTLKDSAVHIRLRGGIDLRLDENTLVVLEPLESQNSGEVRLRLKRGDVRSHSSDRDTELGAGEWVVTAKKGSELNLRGVGEDQFQIEVHRGEAQLSSRDHPAKAVELTQGQSAELRSGEPPEVTTASDGLAFAEIRAELRVYTALPTTPVQVAWQGAAQELVWLNPQRVKSSLKVAGLSSQELNLSRGTHWLRLKNDRETSKTLKVRVLSAPEIIFMQPLPRDRAKTGEPLTFSWLTSFTYQRAVIELAQDDVFAKVELSADCPAPTCRLSLAQPGAWHWRVRLFDELGYSTRADFSYPLFLHPNPLSAPLLREPSSLDDPAPPADAPSVDKSSDPGASLILDAFKSLAGLMIPRAHGAGSEKGRKPVVLSWAPVPGADHYVVEIARSADFRVLEFTGRVSDPVLVWSQFEKRVYYYRVAGGSKDGRLGLFSPAAKIDLSQWPRGAPGISRDDKNIAKVLPKKQARVRAPSLPPSASLPQAESPSLTPPTAVPSVNSEQPASLPTPALPSASFSPLTWQTDLSALYASHHQNEGGLKVAAQGTQLPKLEVGALTSREGITYSAQAWLSSVQWRPESKQRLPFQKDLRGQEWGLRLSRRTESMWSAELGQRLVFRRDNLESSRLQTEFNLGLNYGRSKGFGEIGSQWALGPELWGSTFGLGGHLQLSWTPWSGAAWSVNPKVTGFSAFSPEKRRRLEFGLGVGFSW